ncbi:hypothetical protein C9374_004852 [Naegleria lovaniensis]|uniref:Uncharacterized protein n=1 Tax=Naegleria lovaniensis TaxID=51637 RepID=A0AA88GMA1_NAELO|nr:uncharacterized protein C9374_004852 [Naegleria lovaniensis]KAG2382885.1 hypothetical protein C9374_004852 [Naegleria lovaniensis]
MKKSTTAWTDVTDLLRKTTEQYCSEGEMLHGPGFNLHDVLSVTEIGDPKMDTFLNGPNKEYVYWPKDRFLEGLMKPVNELNLKQIIYMMDELICAVFTWYEGWTLAQTLLTCEYLHHLQHLEQHSDYSDPNNIVKYFHAFCNGILLLKTKVEYVMARTSCRESEEFSYDSCGFPEVQLMESETNVMERFDKLETELSNRVSFLTGKQTTQSFELFQGDKLLEEAITNAILSRISFIKNFILVHGCLSSVTSPQVNNCKKSITTCLTLLKSIKEEREALEIENHNIGFDKHIALLASFTSPLKPIELFSFDISYDAATAFLNEMNHILGVRQCQNLNQLIHFYKLFSFQNQNNSVVSRAYLFYITFSDDMIFGKYKLSTWIEKHLETEIISITDKHLQEMKKQAKKPEPLYQEWITALSYLILKLLNGYTHNKSRLRRVLANLIPDLGTAEQRSELIDVTWLNIDVRNHELVRKSDYMFSFSLFMIDFICEIMHQYLLLGFELDLYHHSELVQVAWYIDYITKIRSMNMNNLYAKKKKTAGAPLNRYQLYSKLTSEVHNLYYRGLCRFILAINKKGLYTNMSAEKEYPLASDELIFTNRFKPFYSTNQPPPVTFEHYLIANNLTHVSEKDLFDSAKDHFDAAVKAVDTILQQDIKLAPYEKQHLEWIQKSAKTNSVSVFVFSKHPPVTSSSSSSSSDTTPSPQPHIMPIYDLSVSKYYPVLKPPKKEVTKK